MSLCEFAAAFCLCWKCLLLFGCRLRLGRLNEEMKDSELGITGDDTFNDVVRDFSQLACSHPERLQRPMSEIHE